jgi:hypothetical protein
MAAAISAATTRNIAYQAVKSQQVRRIERADYTTEELAIFEKDILAASLVVPTTLGGGEHGHSWLLYDADDYKLYSGKDITQTTVPNPGNVPNITSGDSAATVALKTANKVAELDVYYTQEGVKAGLVDLIVANVPKQAIQDLDDPDHGFTKTTPLQLLEQLREGAETVDFVTIAERLEERNAPIDFEGAETLKSFFAKIDKLIKDLKTDHVATSHSELMINYLRQIEGQRAPEFREALTEWHNKGRTGQTWKKFKEIFGEADRRRRRAIKASSSANGSNAGGIHSANAATSVTRDDITEMFANAMQVFGEAADQSIHAAIESKFNSIVDSGATQTYIGSNQAGDAATYKKRIEELEKKLEEAKKSGKKGDGAKKGEDKWKDYPKCEHCNLRHKLPVDQCWKKKGNWDSAPAWWKAKNPKPDGE